MSDRAHRHRDQAMPAARDRWESPTGSQNNPGNAYGAFYLTMPAELREHLRAIVRTARDANAGLWAQATATTDRAARITGLDMLQQAVIWPKLFRRLAPYFVQGHSNFDGLDAWLRADPRNRDDRLLLPTLELGNMHDLIVEDGEQIRLAYATEDVVIVPDDYVLPVGPVVPPPTLPVGTGDVRIVAALIDPLQSPERGHETVTLLNTTAADIDLTGWLLADTSGRIRLGGPLGSGEARRILLGGAVRLSNVRDTITLLDARGAVVDQVSYQARGLPAEGRTRIFGL